MNSQRLGLSLLALLGPALMWGGCGEPSREEARDDIAQVRCDRFEECGQIGSGERFSSMDACVVDQTREFDMRWPAARCSSGHLNEARYEDCLKRASTLACDGAIAIADQQAFDMECSARRLCVDPGDDDMLPPDPTRQELRDEITRTQCNRAQDCGQVGQGKRYEDYAACLAQVQNDFDQLWPADQCDGRVNEGVFDSCNERVSKVSCEGIGGAIEVLQFLNNCNASRVCID